MTKTKTKKATKRASKLLEELSGPMSQNEFNSLSKKEQREAIIALFFPNKCEVNLAKYVLKEREEKCGMIGGARRRRNTRRGRSTSSTRSNASSTTSSSTNTPTQQQTAAQVAQAAAATGQQPPSQAAVEEATSGDIYDLLSIIMVGGGALAAGSLAIAAGLDEGLDALIVANGGTSLSHCTAHRSVTSQLTGAFWGWQQPDMCTRAMDQMDSLIVAVPIAITALCHWFGIRNPITIMAGAAIDSQRAIAERLRGCFTRPPSDPPSPALIHAAALAIDAQRARQTQGNQAAANVIQGAHSPPSQQSTSPSQQSTPPSQQIRAQAVQGLRNIAQQARTRGRSRTSRTSTSSNSQAPPQTVAQAMGSQMPHRTGVSPSVSPVVELQSGIPPTTGFQPSPVPVVTSPPRQSSISSLSSNKSATSSSESEESDSEESSSDGSNTPTPKSPDYSATTPPSPLVQAKTASNTSTTRTGSRRSARLRSKTPDKGGRKKTRKHKGKNKGKKKARHAKRKGTRKHKNRKHKRKGRKTKKH